MLQLQHQVGFPANSVIAMTSYSYSGQVRPWQGTEICNFGAPSPPEALHWIFCFFSSINVQFSKTSPTKSGESSEKSSGENRIKSCHVCGCHDVCGCHGFKNWKKYSRWGAASKNKSKKPWALCRRAGIDAALVRVQFVLRGCTHHRK